MTIEEFLKKFSECSQKYQWNDSGIIRTKSSDVLYCPITAIEGDRWTLLAFLRAKQLGLSLQDTIDIVNAADNKPTHRVLYKKLRSITNPGIEYK